MDKIELLFDEDVLEYIVDKAVEFKLGARGLRAISETIIMDAMYETPSSGQETLLITLDYAKEKVETLSHARLESA